jgi:hypothetical protein
MEFVDRELTCVECNKTFVFSAAEQEFFHDKGFNNDPKRCKQCKFKVSSAKGVRVETHVKCFECGIDRRSLSGQQGNDQCSVLPASRSDRIIHRH